MQWIVFIVAVISAVVIIVMVSFEDKGYFDIKRIIKNYMGVFEKDKRTIVTIYVFLFLVVLGMACIKPIQTDLMNTITIIISILCGAFLAFIPVIIGLNDKSKKKDGLFKQIQKETLDIIMFELFISVSSLFICFIYTFIHEQYEEQIVSIGFSIIIYYILFIIMLNILVILKRMTLLIGYSINN